MTTQPSSPGVVEVAVRLSNDLLGVLAGALSLTAAGCAPTMGPTSAASSPVTQTERSNAPSSDRVVMRPIGAEPVAVQPVASFDDDPTWAWDDVEVEEETAPDPSVEAEDAALTQRLERAKRADRRRIRLAHRPRPPIHPACGRG